MFNEIGGTRKGLLQFLFVAVVLIVCYYVVASRNLPSNEVVPVTPSTISAQ